MYEIKKFIKDVAQLSSESKSEKSMDLIYDFVDELLCDGKFSLVDEMFDAIVDEKVFEKL